MTPTPRRRPAAAVCAVLVAALTTSCTSTSRLSAPDPRPNPLTVGIAFDEPGLSLVVQNEAVGLAPAIGRAVAHELGATGRADVKFVQSTERTRGADVSARVVRLAVGSAEISPARQGGVVAIGPYLTSALQLAVRQGAPAPVGGSVCVLGGSNAWRRLPELLPGARPVLRTTLSACVHDVERATADAVLADGLALAAYASSPAHRQLEVLPARLAPVEHVVLVARDDPGTCRAATRVLRDLVSSGRWQKIVEADLVTTGVLATAPPVPVIRGCG